MDILFKIMLFLHLTSLGVGATANVAMPLLGRQLATGAPAAKPSLGAIAGQISLYSRWAFGVLIVTGIAMLFMRYNGDVAGLGMVHGQDGARIGAVRRHRLDRLGTHSHQATSARPDHARVTARCYCQRSADV